MTNLRKVSRACGLRPSSIVILKTFIYDNRYRTVKEIAHDVNLSMSSVIIAVRELTAKGLLSFVKNDEVYYYMSKDPEEIISRLKSDLVNTIDEYFDLAKSVTVKRAVMMK